MKVAFTTSDSLHINSYFDKANQIDIYEVWPKFYQLVESLKFTNDLEPGFNSNHLNFKIEALIGCQSIYVFEISQTAASNLLYRNIIPLKNISFDNRITTVLEEILKVQNGNYTAWIYKILRQSSINFESLEEELSV